jgi:hypothetical protein
MKTKLMVRRALVYVIHQGGVLLQVRVSGDYQDVTKFLSEKEKANILARAIKKESRRK